MSQQSKNTIYFIIVLLLSLTNTVFGQTHIGQTGEIEGSVTHGSTPIPYASIYNKSLGKGTISNTDGYFRIAVSGITDTIQIRCVGYKDQTVKLEENLNFYSIQLEERILLLGEVIITPGDNTYLYDLVKKCRKSASDIETTSKAYYEIKSYVDTNQIELVAGYYNLDIKGYKLEELHLKAGRIALQSYQDRFFASLESSKALMMLDLFHRNEYFPLNPLELSESKLKKDYFLTQVNKYVVGTTDSIYVIRYNPKSNQGKAFEGKIWINKTKNQILKITLNCHDALIHPFLPMFPTDSISKVSFQITQTFKIINIGKAVFNHTDFTYNIDYKSRIGKTEAENYSVVTRAVLYAYDFNNSFFQPIFGFKDKTIGDYRKINALPYNDFFWTNNAEYRLNDSVNANELFFSDTTALTNKTLFKSNQFSKRGLFEHPYVGWSKKRIKFREMLPDTVAKGTTGTGYLSDKYDLTVKIYLDMNAYKDSTQILTATIFDPYESYYYLPMDNKTYCFINIYFDLCEISRRELDEKLKADNSDSARIGEEYNAFTRKFEVEKEKYFKAVQRGTNETEMRKYNDYIYNQLGIDNIEIFQPFQKSK